MSITSITIVVMGIVIMFFVMQEMFRSIEAPSKEYLAAQSRGECMKCKVLERQLEILKSDKTLCSSCSTVEVETKGDWCETCKTCFAYGA